MVINKINHFNFIRFVLALMVLLAHSSELIDGNRSRELLTIVFRENFSFGEIAVGGFFILSGFLISKSSHDQPGPAQFFDKRVRRIFPAFIVASLICACVVGPIGAQSISQYFSDFHPLAFLWSTLKLRQPFVPPVFTGQPYPFVNGSMWTIPIEFACYLGVLAAGILGGFRRPVCLAITKLFLGICLFQKPDFNLLGLHLCIPTFQHFSPLAAAIMFFEKTSPLPVRKKPPRL